MSDKRMIAELTEQDSTIIIISLELRERNFPPPDLLDRRRLAELKKELTQKHAKVFLCIPVRKRMEAVNEDV